VASRSTSSDATIDQRGQDVELAAAAHRAPQGVDLVAEHPEIMHGIED